MKIYHKISKQSWFEPFLTLGFIILLLGISYLPFVTQLGFYYDDWYITWAGFTDGAQKIVALQSLDRPFQGMEYALAYSVLGENPLGWHLLIFSLRFIVTAGLWFGLRRLLSHQDTAVFCIALIFGVYPGFTSQPHASMMHTLIFGVTCGTLMISATLLAYHANKVIWKILALLAAFSLGLATFFMFEWMIGFCLVLGIILVYQVFIQRGKTFWQNTVKVVLYWLPSLAALTVFLYWRIIIFINLRAATSISSLKEIYLSDPGGTLSRLILEWVKDISEAVLFAWFIPTYNLILRAKYLDLLIAGSLALVGTSLFFLYFRRLERNVIKSFNWKPLIWVGLALTAAGVLVPVLANRDIRFETILDRYTLIAIIGVAIFWVSIIFAALKPQARMIAMSVLIFVGIFTQINSAAHYRDFWNVQKLLWWQLTWRAPDLREDTVLFAVLPEPYKFADDYEVWAPANLIYNTGNSSITIKANILNQETYYSLAGGLTDERNMRTIYFTRDYTNALVISFPDTTSCMRLLDSSNLELSPQDIPLVAASGQYSNINQVITQGGAKQPIASIFGQEPVHGWCYYYQKASLARQNGDWAKIIDLQNEFESNHLEPSNLVEWMPFLEAHYRLGQLDEAGTIAALIKNSPDQVSALCSEISRINSSSAEIENGKPSQNEMDFRNYYCSILLD